MVKLGSFYKFNRQVAILAVAISLLAGCSRGSNSHSLAAQSAPSVRHPEKSSGSTPAPGHSVTKIKALGTENEYANLISQIGGKYVEVSAIMSNPNADPHTFEASPTIVRQIDSAILIVQNGLGYDTFMNKIEQASPNLRRQIIDAQTLLRLPDSTGNPHLWYDPENMLLVAQAIARSLSNLEPSNSQYFSLNLSKFINSLTPISQSIANLKAQFKNAPVATTEPVADYLLRACGLDNKTPWALQDDIMNGTDPSPQSISEETHLIEHHQVKALVYNRQVTDSITSSFVDLAKQYRIPIVGVYETMPTPGFDYQSWMLAEINALRSALESGKSTTGL